MIKEAEIFQWDESPIEVLKEFVLRVHVGKQRAQPFNEDQEEFHMIEPFADYAKSIIEGQLKYFTKQWRYWIGVLQPFTDQNPERWAQHNFPHKHGWNGRTLVHYLQVPERGGQLVLMEDDGVVIQEVEPKLGQSVVLVDKVNHGVRAIHGKTARITIIAGAYPP